MYLYNLSNELKKNKDIVLEAVSYHNIYLNILLYYNFYNINYLDI